MFTKEAFDSKRRTEIETEITAMMKHLRKKGQGFEFVIAPGEEGIFALVIEGIMQKNPEYALVAWPGGPAIVRRHDVDAIPDKLMMAKNVDSGFVTAGGDNFSIEAIDPTPSGGERISSAEYHKAMPNAAEKYGIPELAPKGK